MLASHDIYCTFRNAIWSELLFFTGKTKNFDDTLTSKHTMTADQHYSQWLVRGFLFFNVFFLRWERKKEIEWPDIHDRESQYLL